jgi:hypothetical protein
VSHYKKYSIEPKRDVTGISYSRTCIVPISSGPGGGTEDPYANCGFMEILNVMGQEDLYRQQNGVRVSNYLVARIVVSTVFRSRVNILYSANTELLDKETGFTEEASSHHEIYFDLDSPNALYAFRVVAIQEDCDPEFPFTMQSGIYYFTTEADLYVGRSNIIFAPELTIVTDGTLVESGFTLSETSVGTSHNPHFGTFATEIPALEITTTREDAHIEILPVTALVSL